MTSAHVIREALSAPYGAEGRARTVEGKWKRSGWALSCHNYPIPVPYWLVRIRQLVLCKLVESSGHDPKRPDE
jgi:hypothetical protein